MSSQNISSINTGKIGTSVLKQSSPEVKNSVSAAESFSKTLENAVSKVNSELTSAEAQMADLATGKSKDIHGTMISMQKADLSFKLLVNVRNKIVSAYQEISRMQV